MAIASEADSFLCVHFRSCTGTCCISHLSQKFATSDFFKYVIASATSSKSALFQKEIHNSIPNAIVWRVLTFARKDVQIIHRSR
jgi:hypothetical protein